MTSGADLLNLDQERVSIAIKSDVFDRLRVPARFALHPVLLSRPAPEMGFARSNRFFQRGAVHPRHHQHTPRALLLDYGRNKPVRIELQFVIQTHGRRRLRYVILQKEL